MDATSAPTNTAAALAAQHGVSERTIKRDGRRNLTPDQRSLLRGRRYNRTKKQGARSDLVAIGDKVDTALVKQQHGKYKCPYCRHIYKRSAGHICKEAPDYRAPHIDTAADLAAQHGVHRATIIRDGKKAEALEKLAITAPEQAKAVRDGKKTVQRSQAA